MMTTKDLETKKIGYNWYKISYGFYQKTYMYYTKKEAIQLFKEDMKQGDIQPSIYLSY